MATTVKRGYIEFPTEWPHVGRTAAGRLSPGLCTNWRTAQRISGPPDGIVKDLVRNQALKWQGENDAKHFVSGSLFILAGFIVCVFD